MAQAAAQLTLPDRYRIVRHIANGGMASVWEAHDELLDRRVAVKVLALHLGEDERARRRFDANLQKVRISEAGAPKRVYVCTRCLKAGKVTKA